MPGANWFRKVLCAVLDSRPSYARALLESLRQCEGIEEYQIFANVDEGCDETIALAVAVDFAPIDIHVRPKSRNASERVFHSIQRAFGKAQFTVYADTGTIVTRDFLRFVEHCGRGFPADPDVFVISGDGGEAGDGGSANEIARRPVRWGAAGGIWSNRWEWAKRASRAKPAEFLDALAELTVKHRLEEVHPLVPRCRRLAKPDETISAPGVGSFHESDPPVTAVMITGLHRERYAMARISIECFKSQSYPNKNLLIVNHGEESLATADSRIQELRIHKSRWHTVGDLRNLALEHATGDFIINWDDDDWHHSQRIEVQMQARAEDTAVLLRTRIHHDLISGRSRYAEYPKGAEATILHPRRVPYRYPSLLRGSDSVFAQQFRVRLPIENDPALHIRFFHGRNLWDAAHIMGPVAGSATPAESELNDEHRALLARVLPLYGRSLSR
ncbi:MAG: glycosyltransferase family A protein [Bradyrhizobium sp.]|jgi:hypothetical protein